jgi:hypothetical protein
MRARPACRHAADVQVSEAEAPAVAPSIGESLWPPVAAVIVFLALNVTVRIVIPLEGVFRAPWLTPALEALMLVLLVTSKPTSAAERRRLRRLSLVLVGLLVTAALWATAVLISDLVRGVGVSRDAGDLLLTGAIVWLGNNLSFALLYWLMDGGGPGARTRLETPADFAFTQHMSPELATPGWRPVFLDYLHLGFTNATAFSPTDVMPLTHRAKYAMLVQSTVALALFGLVVARAVNAFT